MLTTESKLRQPSSGETYYGTVGIYYGVFSFSPMQPHTHLHATTAWPMTYYMMTPQRHVLTRFGRRTSRSSYVRTRLAFTGFGFLTSTIHSMFDRSTYTLLPIILFCRPQPSALLFSCFWLLYYRLISSYKRLHFHPF